MQSQRIVGQIPEHPELVFIVDIQIARAEVRCLATRPKQKTRAGGKVTKIGKVLKHQAIGVLQTTKVVHLIRCRSPSVGVTHFLEIREQEEWHTLTPRLHTPLVAQLIFHKGPAKFAFVAGAPLRRQLGGCRQPISKLGRKLQPELAVVLKVARFAVSAVRICRQLFVVKLRTVIKRSKTIDHQVRRGSISRSRQRQRQCTAFGQYTYFHHTTPY